MNPLDTTPRHEKMEANVMDKINLPELRKLLEQATPGPWSVWDSCSFRRITHEADGDVISGCIQRSDGHPDLLATREDLDLLCALRNAAPALIAAAEERDRLREALIYLLDACENSRSGYISGCGEDLKWDARIDDARKDAAKALAEQEKTK